MSARRLSTGRKLFWVGVVCAALTVALFLGGFAAGNGFTSHGAMATLLVGLVLSVILSLVTLVLAIAGLVAFTGLRGRYTVLLSLAILLSPLLWLLLIALFS